VLILLLCVLPSAVLAQLPQPDPGDIWVAFDEIGNQYCALITPFTTDNAIYVLTQDVAGDIAGYEFSLGLDPGLVVFSYTDLTNPGFSINVGTPPGEWIVGIGFCLSGTGIVPLVQLTTGVFAVDANEHLLCPGASDPSSFSPPTPGYLDCSSGLIPFTPYPENSGCSFYYVDGMQPPTFDVGTCSLEGLPTQAESWGSLKSTY
jgi:hypothetical protein